ncbi:AAA-domain-containing protein, partial [Neoconidiobolus thromboides FSU 785]
KTFLAKSLVHECSKEKVPIAYFHVNNADILSKWVGESEIRLKKIFETAKLWAPSIIFFDEIDGLAPIRDENDRPSASLVSSLLAYMDGFKDLGKVLVIGSTNRIEAIDPALRRPGRFDEELYFALPNLEARKSIINAITNSWPIPLDKQVIDKIINLTKGYSGADLKSLCDKAVVAAFIRRNPDTFDKEIGASNIDCSTMKIEECDFMIALKKVTSVSQNLIGMKCQSIVPPYDKLLNPMVEDVLEAINKDLEQNSIIMNENLVPKVVIINGNSGVVQNLILSSTLNNLEDYRIVMIDLTQLCIPDDVTGCKELSLILNGSQFYSTKTLFVIKEVKILHVYCPQLITILRNFMLSPCKKGSVTFLITCDKLKDMSFYFKDVIGKVIQTNDIYLGVKAPFVESLLKEYFDPRIINDNNNNNNDNNLYKGNSFESIQEEKKETSYNQCSLRNLCLSNIMYAMEGLEVQDIIKFSICLKLELIEPCYTALRKQIEQVASEFKKSKKSGIQYIPL